MKDKVIGVRAEFEWEFLLTDAIKMATDLGKRAKIVKEKTIIIMNVLA